MSERTFIPIFCFWAFLTIITPTLILLSENSEPHLLESNGNSTMVLKARRMGGCTSQPPAMTVVKAEELASALAATPTTLSPRAATTSSPTGSFHNHSLGSNIIGQINGSRYYSQNHTYSKSTERLLIDNANKTHP